MQHRAEIDGLRALAVLPVVLDHAGFPYLPAGFLGVDVFFVISGFLISQILCTELQAGDFSLLRFYTRRARRILPALCVMVLIVGGIGWFCFTPRELKTFGQSATATALFLSNLFFWYRAQDYFAPEAGELHLLHSWSLGVEEQFYLVFPLMLCGVWTLCPRRRGLRWGMAGLAVASFVSCLLIGPFAAVANFFLLPSRAWELALGALVALSDLPGRKAEKEVASLLGLVLLIGSYLWLGASPSLPGLPSLCPTIAAALILGCSQGTLVGRWLSLRALTMFGAISYSLYLWHQPVIVMANAISPGHAAARTMGLAVCLSVMLALLSWRYVEQPFRRGGAAGQAPFLASGVAISLAIAGLGSVVAAANGFPGRFAKDPGKMEMASRSNGYCFMIWSGQTRIHPSIANASCLLAASANGRKALLFGDSHAAQYEPMLRALSADLGLTITAVTSNYCHPDFSDAFRGSEQDRAFAQCRLNRHWLHQHLPDFDLVILGATWGELAAAGQLDTALATIAEINRTTPVISLPPPYQHRRIAVEHYAYGMVTDLPIDAARDAAQIAAYAKVSAMLHNPRGFALSRTAVFDRPGLPMGTTSSALPYSLDGRHISITGSLAAAGTFRASAEFQRLSAFVTIAPPKMAEK